MKYTSVVKMISEMRDHAKRYGHGVVCSDLPIHAIGYVCTDCDENWKIELSDLKHDCPFWLKECFMSVNGRMGLIYPNPLPVSVVVWGVEEIGL